MKNQFRVLVAKRKMSVTKISEETGISKTTLYGISNEKIKNPKSSTIMTLCEYLDVTPNEFFGIEQ